MTSGVIQAVSLLCPGFPKTRKVADHPKAPRELALNKSIVKVKNQAEIVKFYVITGGINKTWQIAFWCLL